LLLPKNQKEVRDYANEKLELQELREKTGGEAPKQAPGGTTSAQEGPQGAKPVPDMRRGEIPGIGPNPKKNGETG
jgi:hypothetical protein